MSLSNIGYLFSYTDTQYSLDIFFPVTCGYSMYFEYFTGIFEYYRDTQYWIFYSFYCRDTQYWILYSITGILNIGYFILLQGYSILDILFYYRDSQYWIFYSITGILNIDYFILLQEYSIYIGYFNRVYRNTQNTFGFIFQRFLSIEFVFH